MHRLAVSKILVKSQFIKKTNILNILNFVTFGTYYKSQCIARWIREFENSKETTNAEGTLREHDITGQK